MSAELCVLLLVLGVVVRRCVLAASAAARLFDATRVSPLLRGRGAKARRARREALHR